MIFIVTSERLLEGKPKQNFEELLRKVMEYRNAFTHGDFFTDGRQVKIKYYKSKLIEKFIEDKWLTEIESKLKECFARCMEIKNGISPAT